MNSRFMPTPAFALALLAAGITMGVLGLLGKNDDLWRCGLFLTVTAVPLIIVRTLHHVHAATETQLADADIAGYRRALDHVARGLLDQPAAPPNPRDRAIVEQDAGNVIHLRPSTQPEQERKAL